MSARVSAPWFYNAGAKKEDQGEISNWFSKSLKWTVSYPVSFSGAKNVAKSIRAVSSYFLLFFTSSLEGGGESGRNTLAGAKAVNSFSKNAKNLIAFFSIPDLTYKAVVAIRESLSTVIGRPVLGAAPHKGKTKAQTVFKAMMSANEVIAPVCDSVTMVNDLKLTNLGGAAMKAVGGVNHGSLFIASAVNTPKAVVNIAHNAAWSKVDAKTAQGQRKEVILGLVELAKWVSYLALSTIGLIGLIVMGIPAWIGLTLATSALVFSILGSYCKEVIADGGEKAKPKGWLPVALS